MTILAACGVQREARIAERRGRVVAIPGGGDATGLEARLLAAAPTARAILSFGLAGALAPHLAVGDWVIGARITGGVDTYADLGWTAALLHKLRHPGLDPGPSFPGPASPKAAGSRGKPGMTSKIEAGPVFANGTLAATSQAKAEIHAATGALAIDMESHIAAKVAAAHGLPFACIRVISDTAEDTLPPAFAVAMRPDGGTDIAALLTSLARNPGQLARFIRAARSATAALRQLSLGRDLLGPGLGLPDLG